MTGGNGFDGEDGSDGSDPDSAPRPPPSAPRLGRPPGSSSGAPANGGAVRGRPRGRPPLHGKRKSTESTRSASARQGATTTKLLAPVVVAGDGLDEGILGSGEDSMDSGHQLDSESTLTSSGEPAPHESSSWEGPHTLLPELSLHSHQELPTSPRGSRGRGGSRGRPPTRGRIGRPPKNSRGPTTVGGRGQKREVEEAPVDPTIGVDPPPHKRVHLSSDFLLLDNVGDAD